jgi:hypothetical protein
LQSNDGGAENQSKCFNIRTVDLFVSLPLSSIRGSNQNYIKYLKKTYKLKFVIIKVMKPALVSLPSLHHFRSK